MSSNTNNISSVTMIYHSLGQDMPQGIHQVLFHSAALVSRHPRRGWYSYQCGQSLLACGCRHKVTSTQASGEDDHPSHSRISQQDWHFLFGKNTPNPTGPKKYKSVNSRGNRNLHEKGPQYCRWRTCCMPALLQKTPRKGREC